MTAIWFIHLVKVLRHNLAGIKRAYAPDGNVHDPEVHRGDWITTKRPLAVGRNGLDSVVRFFCFSTSATGRKQTWLVN